MIEVERLYHVMLSRASGLLCKSGKSRDGAKDIVHDVVADVLQPHRIVGMIDVMNRGSLEYYLNRCVYLHVHGSYAKQRYHELTDAMVDKMSAELLNNQQTSLHERMSAENLDLAIRSLDQYESELIRLWMLPDFSYEHCAEATGIDIQLIYKHIKRAINKLRKYVHNTNSATSDLQ